MRRTDRYEVLHVHAADLIYLGREVVAQVPRCDFADERSWVISNRVQEEPSDYASADEVNCSLVASRLAFERVVFGFENTFIQTDHAGAASEVHIDPLRFVDSRERSRHGRWCMAEGKILRYLHSIIMRLVSGLSCRIFLRERWCR